MPFCALAAAFCHRTGFAVFTSNPFPSYSLLQNPSLFTFKSAPPPISPNSLKEVDMDHSKYENILKDFYIPNYILLPESEVRNASHMPSSPVLVFINSKSGGQLGGELLYTYRVLLNENQVFDLDKEAPDKVLHQFYFNIEKLKHSGDILASEIENRLRIIVAGGDGTANWLLGVVSDLKLPQTPPIAIVPLGTGNNLSFSFGWGKKNPGSDRQSVESFLDQVTTAREMKIDSWHITLRMRSPEEGSYDPDLVLPHSLHAVPRVYPTEKLNMERYRTFHGGFWNYFSMGMDAQVSYAFHSERKLHPEKFKKQLTNQSVYAKLACKQGLFCTSLCYPCSWNIEKLTRVRIMKKLGQWEELPIPCSIRSIICLNLPSFSGGLNPWGMPKRNASSNRDFTPLFVDDGIIEVVGFRDAWHGLYLYAPRGHGTRLAQVKRIRFEFHKSAADHVFMRIDGEPWKQPLPVDDNPVVVEISRLGQVSVLATPQCRSRSITEESSSPVSHHDMEEDGSDAEDADMPRKFGAADSFRMPETT